ARHFAEQAELIQNLTNFAGSPIAAMVAPHMSSVKMASVIEDVLNLEDYEIFTPWVQISEAAEQQKLTQTAQEQVMTEGLTPSGLTPDDYSGPGISAALEQGNPPPQESPPDEGIS